MRAGLAQAATDLGQVAVVVVAVVVVGVEHFAGQVEHNVVVAVVAEVERADFALERVMKARN